MKDTTQRIEVDGKVYLVMSKEIFDLRIKGAYLNGMTEAYRIVRDGNLSGDE